MTITVLGSGSSGNGYVIQHENEALIIECGVNYKYAVEALSGNVGKVSGCLQAHPCDYILLRCNPKGSQIYI